MYQKRQIILWQKKGNLFDGVCIKTLKQCMRKLFYLFAFIKGKAKLRKKLRIKNMYVICYDMLGSEKFNQFHIILT